MTWRPSSENCGVEAIVLGMALKDARRNDCRLSGEFDARVVACADEDTRTGVVVAVSASGAEDRRGVIAMIIAATIRTARVPVASATTRAFEPVSTSTFVGPSSDGWRHDLS